MQLFIHIQKRDNIKCKATVGSVERELDVQVKRDTRPAWGDMMGERLLDREIHENIRCFKRK